MDNSKRDKCPIRLFQEPYSQTTIDSIPNLMCHKLVKAMIEWYKEKKALQPIGLEINKS